jgi:hypothetical protein
MTFEIAHPTEVFDAMQSVKSVFDKEEMPISSWLQRQRVEIGQNRELLFLNDDKAHVEILLIMLECFLVRAMKGERGKKTGEYLRALIKTKSDLNEETYRAALREYRWGTEIGSQVIKDVVRYFRDERQWNFRDHIESAENSVDNNFSNDEVCKIKNVGFKLRDLALASFSLKYAAFDLHLVRVSARIGLIMYGYKFFPANGDIEIGTNMGNEKQYFFFRKLFNELSLLTNNKYLAVDLDRSLWHFGRTICDDKPKCNICPIGSLCLAYKN